MSAVLCVRADPLRYADWRAWRALRTDPKAVDVQVHRETCFWCNRVGWSWHRILRRAQGPAGMSFSVATRPFLLPVLCDRCAGRGAIEHVVAVVIS